jgi:hypothetical protein
MARVPASSGRSTIPETYQWRACASRNGRIISPVKSDSFSWALVRRAAVRSDLIQRVAKAVSGKLGGKVGVAPRIFLKKLVGDLLDRIDQFPDFDPERDFSLNLAQSELTETERSAQAGISVDDIDLKL